jgi:hypothetical protein
LWFSLLTEDEQRAIIASIERTPRTCIIVQELLVQLMQAGQIPIRGPLRDYIYANFSLAFRVEGFAFLVRTGRTIAPLGIARVSEIPPAERPSPRFDRRLEFTIVGDHTPLPTIAATEPGQSSAPPLILDANNTRVVTTPVDRAGKVIRPPQAAPWPLRCTGPTRVVLTFDRGGATVELARDATLYLRDLDGQTRHEARVVSTP